MLLDAALWLLVSSCLVGAQTQPEQDDLLSFVTIPKVRALKFNVEYHDRDRVSPGYWFVSPYGQMEPEWPTQRYQPYQIGPHIYDADGKLIWVGSHLFDNRNVFDFRAVDSIGDSPRLSFVLQHDHGDDLGSGIVMGNDYEIEKRIFYPKNLGLGAFDIHEFNVLDDGKTALAIAYRVHEVSMADFDRAAEKTHVLAAGFTVLDLETEKVTYDWDGFDKIRLTETYRFDKYSAPSPSPGWDYVHANSIDRNADGNYLMSMRFTNTVYLISGVDGQILWRLGGKTSDFEQDFVFSRQHDAKFLESNGTHHVISILNNSSDEETNDEEVSSALIVELDTSTEPKTAKLLRRYNRPDGHLTRLRGNAQQLPNKNMFVGWSEAGYLSEFAENGELLLTARFASNRFNTYRAYKMPFTGRPSSPPAVVASVVGTAEHDLSTTFFVSWNGATDVVTWRFSAQASEYSDPVVIGETARADFETMFISSGYMDWIRVEALDSNGTVLGTSKVTRTQVPSYWRASTFQGNAAALVPSNPALLKAALEADLNTGNTSGAGYTAHMEDVKEVLQVADDTYSLIQMIGGLLLFISLLGLGWAFFASGCRPFRRRLRRHPVFHKEGGDREETIGLQSVPPQ